MTYRNRQISLVFTFLRMIQIIFCPAQRKLSYQPRIVIFDNKQNKKVALEHKDYVKYLGILIDKNLSWKRHIDHIIIKVSRTVGLIAKLRHFLPTHTLAGAGTGLIGVEIKKLGYTNLCALDISAEMLTEAKKKEIYTEFICTSLNGQPIPQIKSGQFDALICGGALITGRIGSSAFVEMIRMVQTGGSEYDFRLRT